MSLQCKRKLSQLIAFFFTKINCGTNQYMIIYCCSFSFQVLHLRALNLTFTRQWKSISFMGKICLPVEHNTSFSTSIKTSKQNNRTKLIFSRNMNCGSNDQDIIVNWWISSLTSNVGLFLAPRYESVSPRSSPLLESFAAEMFQAKGP